MQNQIEWHNSSVGISFRDDGTENTTTDPSIFYPTCLVPCSVVVDTIHSVDHSRGKYLVPTLPRHACFWTYVREPEYVDRDRGSTVCEGSQSSRSRSWPWLYMFSKILKNIFTAFLTWSHGCRPTSCSPIRTKQMVICSKSLREKCHFELGEPALNAHSMIC